MPDPDSGASILCEPAQSKRTWTFHKGHFAWKFRGKMPDADSACGHTVWGTNVVNLRKGFQVSTTFMDVIKSIPKTSA